MRKSSKNNNNNKNNKVKIKIVRGINLLNFHEFDDYWELSSRLASSLVSFATAGGIKYLSLCHLKRIYVLLKDWWRISPYFYLQVIRCWRKIGKQILPIPLNSQLSTRLAFPISIRFISYKNQPNPSFV